MCTVTYLPGSEGTAFITSNRDEKSRRGIALSPAIYHINGREYVFPKDPDAGGTWIAADNKGNACVLLNGGFIKHEHKPPYRKSRGLVFLDITTSNNPAKEFETIDLSNIEPFTIIIFSAGNLFECRWDGAQKHIKPIDPQKTHIWSSVTLYTEESVQKRKQWFADWLQQHEIYTQDEILFFHRFGGDGDTHNDLLMNRDGQMLTVSVTGIHIKHNSTQFCYLDLINNTQTDHQLLHRHSTIYS